MTPERIAEIRDHADGSVLQEDVGELLAEVAALNLAGETAREILTMHANAARKANAKVAVLLATLQALYDQQNGPPLLGRHEAAWRKAYEAAGRVLGEADQDQRRIE